MSRKQLDIQAISDDLSASRFFQPTPPGMPSADPADSPTETMTPDPAKAGSSRKRGNTETRNHVSTQPRKRGTTQLPQAVAAPGGPESANEAADGLFDIALAVDDKRTVDLRSEEIETLDDWKRELRRKHGVRITQYNLVRCALHELWNDYKRNGERSIVVKRLRELQK